MTGFIHHTNDQPAGTESVASRSGHRSSRVEAASDIPPDQGRLPSGNAPESLTLVRVDSSPAAPERGDAAHATVSPASSSTRISPHQLRSLPGDLSPRDSSVLSSLGLHAFLTTRQLQSLHFYDHASDAAAGRICRRVLHRLRSLRLIEPLQRRVGGVRAGSASYVWRLGSVGDRLLRQQSGAGIRARRKEPSTYYLEHRLAVADAHLALIVAARAGRFELLDARPEPGCWRSYLGPAGNHLTLKPDFFAVTASGDYEDAWFIEIDRATESIPTLLRKCAQYETYRRSGREQQDGGIFPLVVWQLPHQARLDRLAAALRASQKLDRSLFRLTIPDGLLDVLAPTATGGDS